jgi:hypothetical protein
MVGDPAPQAPTTVDVVPKALGGNAGVVSLEDVVDTGELFVFVVSSMLGVLHTNWCEPWSELRSTPAPDENC